MELCSERRFETARENARRKIRHDATFRATGYDIDDSALAIAKKNAEIAGVADRITFANRDIKDFELEDGFQTIITNPPYGERLLDVKSAEKLYAVMGEHFKRMKGKSYTVISPDDDFEKSSVERLTNAANFITERLNANFICILNNFHYILTA